MISFKLDFFPSMEVYHLQRAINRGKISHLSNHNTTPPNKIFFQISKILASKIQKKKKKKKEGKKDRFISAGYVHTHLTLLLNLKLSLKMRLTNSTSPPSVMVSFSVPLLHVEGTGLRSDREPSLPNLSSRLLKKGGLHIVKVYCFVPGKRTSSRIVPSLTWRTIKKNNYSRTSINVEL